jgi:hypothetical protein
MRGIVLMVLAISIPIDYGAQAQRLRKYGGIGIF